MNMQSTPTTLGKVLNNTLVKDFAIAYEAWKQGMSSVSITFFSVKSENESVLKKARVIVGPLPFKQELEDVIETDSILAGRIFRNIDTDRLDNFLNYFLNGNLQLSTKVVRIPANVETSFHSHKPWPEPLVFEKKLQIRARLLSYQETPTVSKLNDELRTHSIPFDGLNDLTDYLGFTDTNYQSDYEGDLILAAPVAVTKCTIGHDKVLVEIVCHPNINRTDVSLCIVGRTGTLPLIRRNISQNINWTSADNELRGIAIAEVDGITAAKVLLSFGGESVVRIVYFDEEHRPNQRLSKYLTFDPDLRRLRHALSSLNRDSRSLEAATATLTWLYGFSPTPVLETNAPDLIIESPQGSVGLIECTTKVADLREKAGKLVDRRYEFASKLKTLDSVNDILGLLVINLPKQQIVDEDEYLLKQRILLLTEEDLTAALNELNFPDAPDKIFKDAVQKLAHKIDGLNNNGLT